MRPKHFIIPSLVAAGFGSHDPAQAAFIRATTSGMDDLPTAGFLRLFKFDHAVTLANHSSHSSHSSHASHSSGYSGGGHYSHTSHRSSTGGYDGYTPEPVYVPVPSPAPSPSPSPTSPPLPTRVQPLIPQADRAAPPPTALPSLSGRSARFAAIVRRVQIALLARNLYRGAIDGIVGPHVRNALRKFQKSKGLNVTGTITPETLDALMVNSD